MIFAFPVGFHHGSLYLSVMKNIEHLFSVQMMELRAAKCC